MKKASLRWVLGLLVFLLMLYPAYQIKSAMGIDIIRGYHAPDLIKLTFKAIAHKITS